MSRGDETKEEHLVRISWRWILGGAIGATGLFVALVAAFQMEGQGRDGEALEMSDVVGVWQGSDGGRLTLRTDGSADLEKVTRPGPECGRSADAAGRSYTGPATWVFDTYPDENPGVRFDYQGPATAKPCKLYLVVFHQQDGTKGFLPQDPPGVRYVRSTGQEG
ncbi:hypothetical protein [Streptomyces sp. NPDC005533]|uniref:hypothetical protein n=1 Tax=Streptomyces sp. NPDC005533 TaxID=3364723 RepID=UPI00369B29E2